MEVHPWRCSHQSRQHALRMAVATACTGNFGVSTDWLVIIVPGCSIGKVWMSVAFIAADILIRCPLSTSVACINPIGITPGCATSRCPLISSRTKSKVGSLLCNHNASYGKTVIGYVVHGKSMLAFSRRVDLQDIHLIVSPTSAAFCIS